MRFVSLFAGFGGLDLGLERAGMRCIAQVECNEFCRQILARHWPRVPRYTDVRTFTRGCIRSPVEAVVGGFPCQDISCAGRKVGITGERSGLWKQMLRIIRSFRPPIAIVENVGALRSRGLDVVMQDLAESGYDAQWDCLPAAAFGAWHVRDRIFIVAYPRRWRWDGPSLFTPIHPGELGPWPSKKDSGLVEIAGRAHRRHPEHLRVDDGLPNPVERIKGYGNAVVPQVAEYLGRRVLQFYSANRARDSRAMRDSRRAIKRTSTAARTRLKTAFRTRQSGFRTSPPLRSRNRALSKVRPI